MEFLDEWMDLFSLGGEAYPLSAMSLMRIMKLVLIPCNEAQLADAARACGFHGSNFSSDQVKAVYVLLDSRSRRLELRELVDSLRMVEARSSRTSKSSRISRSDFELLNKVVNKSSLTTEELDSIFGSESDKDIHDLSAHMLGLLI